VSAQEATAVVLNEACQERIHRLSEEMERSLMKAFDNQGIVNGLSAFAILIKQA
jgi:hypothetical protein